MNRLHPRLAHIGVLILTATVLLPAEGAGQVSFACYVPSVGAVYRIRTGGDTPESCLDATHVEFGWITGTDGSVTSNLIADGAVTDTKLAVGSVTSSALATGSVGRIEHADNSVTTAAIVDGAVTPAKLDPTVPVAFAFANVDAAGNVLTGSANVESVVFNAGSSRYEITFSGVSFLFSNFVVVVTPIGGGAPRFVSTSSVGGQLLVFIQDLTGAFIQDRFQFVVYQP